MSDALTFAFLGCGRIAARHAATLRRIGGVRRMFASRDAGRAASFNRQHRGDGAFASYAAAITDPGVTTVVVVTPPDSHRELTLAALAAGKDVIVEKPAYLSVAEADEVAAAATAAGRRVLVAENYHYRPLLRTVQRLLAERVIGDLRLVQLDAVKHQHAPAWLDRPGMQGALWEGGIHWVHFLASLGPAIRDARGWVAGPGDAPERTTLLTAAFEGGAIGSLAYSWEVPTPLKGLRMSHCYGTEGVIAFESNGLFVRVSGRRHRLLFPGFRDISGFGAMFTDFVTALREGREPSMTLAQARRDLALVEACHRPATSSARSEES